MYDHKETTSEFMDTEQIKSKAFADLVSFLKDNSFLCYEQTYFD